MDMIEPRAIVDTLVRNGVLAPDELVEQGVAPLPAVGNLGEGCVLSRDTDATVPQHEY
jgi:hypothetical protein